MVWREGKEKKVKIFNFDMKQVTALKFFITGIFYIFHRKQNLKKKSSSLPSMLSNACFNEKSFHKTLHKKIILFLYSKPPQALE